MYDAKKLPLKELVSHAKSANESIGICLHNLGTLSEHDHHIIEESVKKILDRVSTLPAGQAVEMLEGLSQIMNIVCGRVNEVEILSTYMTDPNFVPSNSLVKIIQDKRLYDSCNLPERFIPCVPKDLLPEGFGNK